MTPDAAIRRLKRLEVDLVEGMQKATRKTARKGLVLAHKLSSGTASYKTLRREDYPYATRHGSPLRNPTIINRHSGDFYRSWTILEHRDGIVLFADEMIAPYAKFLETGTRGRVVANAQQTVSGNKGNWSRQITIRRGGMFARSIKDDIIFELQEEYVLNLVEAQLSWEAKANSFI